MLTQPRVEHTRDRDSRQSTGRLGEDLAVETLRRLGYAILARRHRTRYGEIDIIARDGDTMVFVEVRTRRSRAEGTAAESVTSRKQQKIAAMALDYLARRRQLDCPCRFDVVAIDGFGTPYEVVRHIIGAFQVE